VTKVLSYGHYTSMQVRAGRVHGLRHHLERLDGANRELFGKPLDGDVVRARVREALDGTADAAVRVVVVEEGLLVEVSEPVDPPVTPQRLLSVPYVRPFAHLKHLGTFAQARHARLAREQGYDDALLIGPDGLVTETSIANVGFFTHDAVVWPDAAVLPGTTMRILEAAGAPAQVHRPVRLADLPAFEGAFLANSRGVSPVVAIDDVVFPVDDARLAGLAAVYAAAPADEV
jgi:branched-subunit amino acid aminotransferase/4-amino-4-deoxychorismate lyase